MKNYLVFHDNCMDGFLAASVMLHNLIDTADSFKNKIDSMSSIVVVAANYSDKPIEVEAGDNVYLVDFCYPVQVIEEFLLKGANVGIYDHHDTSINALLSASSIRSEIEWMVQENVPLRAKTDNTLNYSQLFGHLVAAKGKTETEKKSGAGIVYDVYKENFKNGTILFRTNQLGENIEQHIHLAQIHDLWLHDGAHNHPATFLAFYFKEWRSNNKEEFKKLRTVGVNSLSLFVKLKESYFNTSIAEKLNEGQKLVKVNVKAICEVCKTAKEVTLVDFHPEGMRVGFIDQDVTKLGISMAGSILVKEYGYDVAIITAVEDDEKTVYSLRSDQHGKDFDVAKLCTDFFESKKAITGGGHRNAAGVTFKKGDKFFNFN